VAPDEPGGYYNVTEWVTPGYATKAARLEYGSISQNTSYEFIVQPTVTGLSSNTGGQAGQTLTINGTGFSTNPAQVSVQVAGLPCTVVISSPYQVVCTVAPSPASSTFGLLPTTTTGTQVNGFISGSGLSYTRYDITNLSTKTVAGVQAALAANASSLPILEQGIKGDLQTPNIYEQYFAQIFKGYFVAPTTGNYIFRGLADDFVSVYLSNVTGSAELNYSTPLI
jgi:hypothetical protein